MASVDLNIDASGEFTGKKPTNRNSQAFEVFLVSRYDV